ncbi:MAG: FG-GAP-like repeat-containing protein, partial [Fidelibacterota bacterium]
MFAKICDGIKAGLILIFVSTFLFNCTYYKSIDWTREMGPTSAGYFHSVAVGDLNGDGNLDIVGGNNQLPPSGGIDVWFGGGDGSFAQVESPIKLGDMRDVAISDVNKDGYNDIIASSQGDIKGIQVFFSQGDGSWRKGISPVEVGVYEGIDVADFNNDGNPDIVAANGQSVMEGGVDVWFGNGEGLWTKNYGPEGSGIFKDVRAADFNNDGRMDIAATSWGIKGGVHLWYGDGRANWYYVPDLKFEVEAGGLKDWNEKVIKRGQFISFWGIDAADLNNDGWVDIVAGSFMNGIFIWYNNEGRWKSPELVTEEGSYWGIRAADLDGDKNIDIVAASYENKGIKLFRNPGGSDGKYQGWKEFTTNLPVDGNYYGIEVEDLNGDKNVDIIAANYSQGVHLWFQLKGAEVPVLPPISIENIEFSEDSSGKRISDKLKLGDTSIREVMKQKGFPGKEVEENSVFKVIDGKAEYKLGIGDIINISIWTGLKQEKYRFTIPDDGNIFIPLVSAEPIEVESKTSSEINRDITEKLSVFLREPRVEVFIEEYNSKRAQLIGEVGKPGVKGGPGTYPLTGRVTVVEFLNSNGGPGDKANLKRVQIMKETGKIFYVDLERALYQGDETQDPYVDDGDVIFIPSMEVSERYVYVLGEVNKPGKVDLIGEMRFMEAIAKAGNLTKYAVKDKIVIARGDPLNPEIMNINYDDIVKKGDYTQNIVLQNNDVIYVN